MVRQPGKGGKGAVANKGKGGGKKEEFAPVLMNAKALKVRQ